MRRNASGEWIRTTTKKRAPKPRRLTALIAPAPTRRNPWNRASAAMDSEFLCISGRGIVKRHGTVRRSVDELAHERIRRRSHLVRRALRDDAAFGDKVEVIDDLEG